MKRIHVVLRYIQTVWVASGLVLLCAHNFPVQAQSPKTPDQIYGELFHDVQTEQILPDGKTFVDCIPKKNPEEILQAYRKIKKSPPPGFSLKQFVDENFEQPKAPQLNYVTQEKDVVSHIEALWSVLKREPDQPVKGSSLLALPHPYVVPGGRFREVYYWDSYFTMLGLKESGQAGMIENMIKNFAWMIDKFGHIPNGNRTYYLSRSQPPFFALMVDLLADIKGKSVYTSNYPALEKEYRYWMEGADQLKPGSWTNRVVKLPDGTLLNRYWDDSDAPRQESYREDLEVAETAVRQSLASTPFKNEKQRKEAEETARKVIYRHLRSSATSGWDFSCRWFSDGKNMSTIITTNVLAVDLNCLLYHLEKTLALACSNQSTASASEAAKWNALAGEYSRKAADRKKAIETYCWNEAAGVYTDYDYYRQKPMSQVNLAGMYPLFFQVADRTRAEKQTQAIMRDLLKEGGLLTTPEHTGQQWDAPNGWAPLQWMAIIGLEKYGYFTESRNVAERWVKLNKDVFARTGKLMEKYNVEQTTLEAGGGEYPSQDGFGWTNGVLLALIKKFNL